MKTLHERILGALKDRQSWEAKQRVFYALRHEGLRRTRPPFPGAADLHYPLVDGAIEKSKPFYFNQLFSGERLAEFVGLSQETRAMQEAAASYFDYALKEESNFATEIMSTLDTMLLRARGIVKVWWDAVERKLCFDAVDPLFFITPSRFESPDKGDWFVHVKHVSVEEFQRDPRYPAEVKTAEMIKRIGGGQSDDAEGEQERYEREGITYASDEETLVIWETWQKTPGGWTIYEYSPKAPGVNLRRPRGCPYRWQGKPWQPFVSLVAEVKDKGWFSPRGVAERLGHFETSLCKLWNEKLDAMTFFNRPLFRMNGDAPANTVNITFRPGEVLPKGVEPATMPQVPFSFDQEMTQQRMVAEQYIALPEAGLAPDPARGDRGDKPTARQVQYQETVQTTVTNMRGWVFRLGLADIYWRAWALIVQYQCGQLCYYAGQELNVLPEQAKSDQFKVRPAGAVDGWNKPRQIQLAHWRLQALNGDQFINQEELRRAALSAEDPRLVNQLLLPQGMAAANEAEDEAMEVVILMSGFPAVAQPGEDHLTRIKILIGKLEQLGMTGAALDPIARQRLQEHLVAHLKFLMQQNPQVARQIMGQLQSGEQPPQPEAGAGAPNAEAIIPMEGAA